VPHTIPPDVIAMFVERAREIFYQVRIDGDPLRGAVTFVSPQCQRLTGYPPEEFVANPDRWFEQVHPDDVLELMRQTTAILASRHEGTRYYRIRDGEGCYWHVEDRIVPMVDASHRVVGYHGVARDITDRVEAEEQRRRAVEALKNAERGEALGRLAAGVAHDFNNILTVIVALSESVRTRVGESHPALADLREIDACAQRAARLVKQLMGFSRMQDVQPEAVSIAVHVSALEAMLRHAATDRVDLKMVFGPSPWSVFIDPSQVDQIVLNLVTNARDAMPAGGRIEITVSNVELTRAFCDAHRGAEVGDYVCIRVRDTGVGMEPDVVKHAFVPFFTTKPEGQGTGIGLASVFGIVKQNLGYVRIESEVGKGTSVSVYLRRHRADTRFDAPGGVV
jgi:PAS domain S-box-containing protein